MPLRRASCARRALAHRPGLSSTRLRPAATWSLPMTSACGWRVATACALASASRTARSMGSSPASAVSWHPGASASKASPKPSEQLTAVAGSGGQDQAGGGAHFGTRITFEKQWVSDKNSFDLGRPATYYTRPMSPPWSKPLEVDRLADGGADVDFAIPLAELSGLRPLRAGVGRQRPGRAHFTRQRGLAGRRARRAQVRRRCRASAACSRWRLPLRLAGAGGAGQYRGRRGARCRRNLSRCSPPAVRISIGASSSRRSCC